VHALTSPLITKADGTKMGKSEGGALWLDPDLTSPYAFYQYWVNVDDSDAVPFLRRLTFLSREAVDALAVEHGSAPERRAPQRELARALTELVHGTAELARVEAASTALFGGEVKGLDERTLAEVFADVPHSEHPRSLLEGEGLLVVDLLAQTTLATSKREARQFLQTGAVAVNGERVGVEHRLSGSDLLHGARILLRRGKRQWHATRFV
jgi:tyrosyl-tRNA synthetase